MLLCAWACAPVAKSPGAGADWDPLARKWYDRAAERYSALDFEGAEAALESARRLAPDRLELRLLGARIALAQMRYDETLQALREAPGPEATHLRARALWYSGQLERTAEVLGPLANTGALKGEWAEGVYELSRTAAGREPFRFTGDRLAMVEMLRLPQPLLVLPVELNGEAVLAMIATASSEVVVDSSQGQPSWVSLRFARRVEVKDVPALGRDLSGISKATGVPIRMLLGVNLLRRLNSTFDFHGGQFIVRNYEPEPPPGVSALSLSYVDGGAMAFSSPLKPGDDSLAAAFLVDSEVLPAISVSSSGWQKAGVELSALQAVPGQPGIKQGVIPQLTLGRYRIPQVPALYHEQPQGQSLDGVVGSALLAEFRVSLVDQGKLLWLEQMPGAEVE